MPNIRLGGVTGSGVDSAGAPVRPFLGGLPPRSVVAVAASVPALSPPIGTRSSNGAGHVPFFTASLAHSSLKSNTALDSALSPAAAASNQHIFVASRSDRRLVITIILSKLARCPASLPRSFVLFSTACTHIVTIWLRYRSSASSDVSRYSLAHR